MKALASNTLLQNRYLVVHLIGRGGMGEVYLAVDQRLGNPVALKRTVFFDDPALGNAFEREAKTLARLRHNVLPKVSDHFIEDGNQYLVMEYIAGDDLSKRLEASKKPFPLEWVVFWADRLLDALDYLHSNEPPIIHRDIKPQNLKLTEDNQIVLLDFGLSKNSVTASRLSTTAPSVLGYTPQYAPMEQIRGTGTDARSDIYSLSSTLYQLLTDAVPPDALTRADALLNEKPDPIQAINEINSEVTPLISEIVLKGMEITRDKRFSAAREMQKLLRDAYAAETSNKNSFSSSVSCVEAQDERFSLRTNISIGNVKKTNSEPNVYSSEGSGLPVNSESLDDYKSAARKPFTEAAFASSSNFNANNNAFATSIPNHQPRSEFDSGEKLSAPAYKENRQKKSSSFFLIAGGTFLFLIAALAFGFYISGSSNEKIEASETAPIFQPSVQPAAKPTASASADSAIEPAPSNALIEEKSEERNSTETMTAKPVQPSSIKTNQIPAPLPEPKISKPVSKPAAKITAQPQQRKPTPLPRILP